MGKRDTRILEVLTQRKRVEVVELARELGVSAVTMRKDLDALEARGVIVRQHGHAALGNPNDINGRLAYHYETKQSIAARACELVDDGETVMVESGSCCALLASALDESGRSIVIVTNSAFIAGYVRNARSPRTVLLGGAYQNDAQVNVGPMVAQCGRSIVIVTNSAFIAGYVRNARSPRTVLLGGAYQNDAQVNVGPMVAQCAENFRVERLFIGVDGFTREQGFTNSDQMRAQAVRDMAARATEVVVLTESEKFDRSGVVPLNLGDKIRCVITDDGIAPDIRARLENDGVRVITVPAA